MATFRVGQRVRVIASVGSLPSPLTIGAEGVVVGRSEDNEYPINVHMNDRTHWTSESGCEWFAACELAPLTDPLATQFIERMKKTEPARVPELI